MIFSRGEAYRTTVWTPQAPKYDLDLKFEKERSVSGKIGETTFVINSRPDGGSSKVPQLLVIEDRKTVARIVINESPAEKPNAKLVALRLDPTSSSPQIVFSSYWGGAHCCTVTKILTKVGATWRVIDGETLDGDGGYGFEDLDGDGTYELLASDNSFLYRFSSYADSMAPLRISKLVDGKLTDASGDPKFQPRLRQDLHKIEHWASLNPEQWRSNGFLGGWVAAKAAVGQFNDAWTRMSGLYDRNADWPMTECAIPLVKGACPKGQERNLDFPTALRTHLAARNYIRPTAVQPSVAAVPASPPAIASPAPPPVQTPAPTPPAGRSSSTGTGFFVSRAGHVVTNAHVVKDCATVTVRPPGAAAIAARITARDAANDLALLETGRQTETFAAVRPGVRLGEPVAVFGYPLTRVLASSGNFTLGNVTALAGLRDDSRYIQISAPVQPGNSGGPLLDEQGNVVGVVTAKLDAVRTLAAVGDIPQNVNFAIKASGLTTFLESNRLAQTAPAKTTKLSSPDLAEAANAISAHIVCE